MVAVGQNQVNFMSIEIQLESIRTISANQFRTPGEKFAFFVSVIPVVIISIVTHLWIPALFVLFISFFAVIFQQKNQLGGSIRISPRQFSHFNTLSGMAADRLCMPPPDIFLKQSPEMNAFAIGVDRRCSVVLYTGLVEYLTNEEFLFVVGHEMGHIKAGHTRLNLLGGLHNVQLGIPVITPFLGYIFSFWRRKAEYTADRAGLIACENIKAAVSALMKLAVGPKLVDQLDLRELMGQHAEMRADRLALIAETLQGHPYALKRITAVVEFYRSRVYADIMRIAPIEP